MLFADDIVIMAETEEQLQKLLNFVNDWCRKWRMKVNKDKTKVMHFRRKAHNRTNSTFYLGGNELEIVDEYKYLGVFLDEYLDYNTCANILAGAAGRALGGIISKFKSIKNVGFETFTKFYHSGIVPIIDYCSGFWGFKTYNECNKIQQRALRYFVGVHSKSPLLALEGDTGWLNGEKTCGNV